MKDIYLTLVSDVTSDYSGNVANKFKIKPKLRLPGEGWKVSIQSAILPKMSLFKDMQSENVAVVSTYGKTEKSGGIDNWSYGWIKSGLFKEWEKNHMATTAEDFFNRMIHRIKETTYANMASGYKFSKDRLSLDWDKNAAESEIIISSDSQNNVLSLEKSFGKKMGWIVEESAGKFKAGKNMVQGYHTYAKGTTSLSNGREMKLTHGRYVGLNTLSDWRFINIKQSFTDALNLHERSLTVTANVTANSETVTQSLGQVYYAPEDRERYLFTPPVKEFYEVQTEHWNEVEIELKELDEKLVNFQPDSQCLIRLHFKKD